MKVCKVIWSTNRLEYLIPTLKSQRDMLDFSGCQVEGIFIDDMPKGRHDGTMFELAKNANRKIQSMQFICRYRQGADGKIFIAVAITLVALVENDRRIKTKRGVVAHLL